MSATAAVLYVVRLIHVLAGVGWFGEVLAVTAVLLPALARASAAERGRLLTLVFPRVARLATVLGGTALASGLLLASWYTQGHPARLLQSTWGRCVLAGAVLGGALYAFHLFQESRLEQAIEERLGIGVRGAEETELLLRRLTLVPRIGAGILLLVIGCMVAAGHLP